MRRMKERSRLWLAIGLVLAALTAGPTAAGTPAESSLAALPGHWSGPVVLSLAELSLVPRADQFFPTRPMTGQAWAGWLCAVTAWPDPPGPGCAAAVPASAGPALTTAGEPITRGQALTQAAALATAQYLSDPPVPPDIRDHPHAASLYRALQAGLVRGYPDGTLQPDRSLTWAESALILGRLLVNRHERSPWQLEPDRQTPLDRLRLRLHPELVGPHRYLMVRTAGGQTVAQQVRVAETWTQRMVGAESGLGTGLLLLHTQAIHTRWGPVPLDVVFLDSGYRITALYRKLPRNSTAWGGAQAAHALELPGGAIDRLQLRLGELLSVQETDH